MLASAMPIVQVTDVTGLAGSPFTGAWLLGSWDGWTPHPMQLSRAGELGIEAGAGGVENRPVASFRSSRTKRRHGGALPLVRRPMSSAPRPIPPP